MYAHSVQYEGRLAYRKWYTHDSHVESQKLLEKASISNDAGFTSMAKWAANIREYPGHLSNIACYDGNPRNQILIGVDWICVNKTLLMASEQSRQEMPGECLDNNCFSYNPVLQGIPIRSAVNEMHIGHFLKLVIQTDVKDENIINVNKQCFYSFFNYSSIWKLHPCVYTDGQTGEIDHFYVMAT